MAKTKKKPVHEVVEGIEKHDGKVIEKDDSATVVHTFPLGRDAGVVSVSAYKNKKALDLRRFYLGEEDERWYPTSKGIRIPAEQVEAVLDALHAKRSAIVDLLS